MAFTFTHGLDGIEAGILRPRQAAEKLYDGLTDEEKLWLLDADVGAWQFQKDLAKGGYNHTPYCAGAIERLGIPGIRFSDGPRGCCLGESTAFPSSISRAATFDADLEQEIGRAIGAEMRAQGANLSGSVCINLARHPGWGRSQESYGEDPLVLGTMGTGLTLGLRHNVIACVKHFALNSVENMRFEVDVLCDEQTLHECYLPHFRQCIEEGGAESLMSAYNTVNGIQAGENPDLLNGVIRRRWGRDDVFVMTDFIWGMRDGVASIRAGQDLEMPLRNIRARSLPKAIAQGSLDISELRPMGIRLLAAQLLYYSRMRSNPKPSMQVVRSLEHRQLARRAASQGMTLIKNSTFDGSPLLPLRKGRHRKIAVIGVLAESEQTGDNGSSRVRDPDIITPLAGFNAASPDIITVYNDGKNIAEAIEIARDADAVFLLVGFTGSQEGESFACTAADVNCKTLPGILGVWVVAKCLELLFKGLITFGIMSNYGGDRNDLQLVPHERRLSAAIVEAAGNKTITAIESGSIVILPEVVRRESAAIMFTWYGGCEFGNALQDVLWGHKEPSGRLPYAIPFEESQLVPWKPWAKQIVYDRWFGYRLLDREGVDAEFPFGFGLGYGRRTLVASSLKVSSELSKRFFQVSVDVKHDGDTSTVAVVQIYGGKAEGRNGDDYTSVLLGFNTVTVEAGQTVHVTIGCRVDPVSHWTSATNTWQLDVGKYNIKASQYHGDPESVVAVVRVPQPIKW